MSHADDFWNTEGEALLSWYCSDVTQKYVRYLRQEREGNLSVAKFAPDPGKAAYHRGAARSLGDQAMVIEQIRRKGEDKEQWKDRLSKIGLGGYGI